MSSPAMPEWTHRYVWGNNPVRAKLKGQRCYIVGRSGYGAPRSCLVEFEDGSWNVVSPRALRRLEPRDA